MIVAKIHGGLGNQLFEYAFARSLQNKIGGKLILDISDFKYDKLRSYSLHHFKLNNDVCTDFSGRYNLKYDQRINKLIKIGSKLFPELQFALLSRFGIYIWDYAKYIEINVGRHDKCYLHGYWQGYDYFEDILNIIQTEFQVKESVNIKNIQLLNEITTNNSVCVHVRRGDFLSSSNKLINCSNNYYLEAMKYLEENDKNLVYYIFSDDIKDVKEKFTFGDRKVVYVNNNNPDYEELRIMYNCKNFIIANSTFSWWAAVLSQRGNKKVVAPREWYTDKRDVSHLLLDNWKIIDNV